MGRKPILSVADVMSLLNRGYNQSQIAEHFDVTKAAVSKFVSEHTQLQTPRQTVRYHFPWKVPSEMQKNAAYKRMRDHGEWMETGGRGMQAYKLDRLRSWYRTMREENTVLEFDPEIVPREGMKYGGFAYRPREPKDGDLLIRVNQYTEMTPEGRTIWAMPDPEDEP